MPNRVVQDIGFAILISGYGRDNNADLNNGTGTLWMTDRTYRESDDLANITQRKGLLPISGQASGISSSKGTEINPFKTETRASAHDFQLRLSDDIAEEFLHTQQRTPYELESSLERTETGNAVLDANQSGLLNGQSQKVVWIDDEAILIEESVESNTSYKIPSNGRGYYSSYRDFHRTGKNIYTQFPGFTNRVVELYRVRLDRPTLTLAERIWHGFIENEDNFNLQTNSKGTTITLPCSDVLTGRNEWTVNHERNKIDLAREEVNFGLKINLEEITVSGFVGSSPPDSSRVLKDSFYTNNNKRSWWKYKPTNSSTLEEPAFFGFSNDKIKKDALESYIQTANPEQLDRIERRLTKGKLKELFCVTRQIDDPSNENGPTPVADSYSDIDSNSDYWSSTWPLKQFNSVTSSRHSKTIDYPRFIPYHPIAIDAALCLSTPSSHAQEDEFDILSDEWALNLRWMFSGDDALEAIEDAVDLINKYPFYQVDHIVAGWKEDPIEWLKWSEEKLLYPNDFTRVIKKDGTLSWSHVSELDVEEYDKAAYKDLKLQPIPNPDFEAGQLKYHKTYNIRASKIWSEYNDLPWIKENREITLGDDADISKSTKKTNRTIELDLSVYQTRGEAQKKSLSKLAFQSFDVPAIEFRVRSQRIDRNDQSLNVGEKIAIKEVPTDQAWIVDTEGNRVNVDNDVSGYIDPQWCGVITRRKYNVSNDTYDVTLLLTNHLDNQVVRQRAPSAIVHETDELNNTVYFEQGNISNSPLTGSSYGNVNPDVLSFAVGDEVKVMAQDLSSTIVSGREIIDLSSSKNDKKQAPSGSLRYWIELDKVDKSYGTGNVFRVENMSNFSSENRGFDSNIDRPFVYLASDDSKLRKGSNEEEKSDRYG